MASNQISDRCESPAAPRRQLTLLDSTSIIVGIVIGSTIYQSSPLIACQVPNVAWLIGVWLLGGLLSLVGALCYAELANAYPTEGGDYAYLTQGFGRTVGLLFAWIQFWIVRPGSIGTLAYVFAQYANQLYPLGNGARPLIGYAVGAIVFFTGINLLGIREGKWTQNVLTIVKFLGLAAIVLVGFCSKPAAAPALPAEPHPFNPDSFAFAMILIFYAYSGWNEMAYVGSEVRDPAKNILRALLLGTVAVAALYILVTLAFVYALGFEGLRQSKAVAVDVVQPALGLWGSRAISTLICISALGAINGMIFTGSRIYYAMGTEHRLFAWLGRWDSRREAPIRTLLIQAAVTVALVIGFGQNERGFENSVIFTAPPFWIFLFLTGLTIFVLRYRDPDRPRPYRVPLYPITPIIFCISNGFMIYKSVTYAWKAQSNWSVLGVEINWIFVLSAVAAVGLVLSFFDTEPRG
jgi:amino acid transporter